MYWGTLSRQECEPRRELCKSVPRVSRDVPRPQTQTANCPQAGERFGRCVTWPLTYPNFSPLALAWCCLGMLLERKETLSTTRAHPSQATRSAPVA